LEGNLLKLLIKDKFMFGEGIGHHIAELGRGAKKVLQNIDRRATEGVKARGDRWTGQGQYKKPKAELDQKPEAKTEKSKNNSGNYPLNIDLRRTLYNEGSEGVSGELARLKQTRQEIQNQQEKVN